MGSLALLLLVATTLPTADALLDRAIAYHDPDGTWMQAKVSLRIETGYADGRTRVRDCWVDYPFANYGDRREENGRELEQEIVGGECTFRVDGTVTVDPDLLQELGLTCDRAAQMRDYISYLWGLPMKLRDDGTNLGEVTRTTFQDQAVLDLKVTYDPEVGTDVWHVYVEEATGRMVGYAFYKDATETNGEIIVLEEEVMVGSARIPKVRHWYLVPDDKFLGTDTLLDGAVRSMTP